MENNGMVKALVEGTLHRLRSVPEDIARVEEKVVNISEKMEAFTAIQLRMDKKIESNRTVIQKVWGGAIVCAVLASTLLDLVKNKLLTLFGG